MDGLDSTYIPAHLDDPWKLWWFDAEAVIAFAFAFMIGILANEMKYGALLGFFIGMAVQKLKSGKHPGYATHLAYWYLPEVIVKLKRVPPSHLRDMIG